MDPKALRSLVITTLICLAGEAAVVFVIGSFLGMW